MYICECGEQFEKLGDETQAHVLDQHLDLIEDRFEDFVEELEFSEITEWQGDELYQSAINDVEEELMDEIIDEGE